MVRKAYLTPPDIPEGLTCRTLKMPDSKEWLGVFNSALLTTLDNWRWEQVNLTDLTIDQAVAKCKEILEEFWLTSECDVCTLPGGEPIIRVAPDGSIEQLTPGGWSFPTGDYSIPDITPREDGTPDDQICLAAKNAVNVLKLVYEELTDYYNGAVSQSEALANILLFIAAIIATAVALWMAAIIALIALAWDVVWDTLEFIGADLWDDNFDKALTCIFIACASNDDGVVTFDWDCVHNALAAQTDITSSLTFDQLRLYGQIVYILSMIGGDGLNLAGATTAIADDDCNFCDEFWCFNWDFTVSTSHWSAATFGAWTSGIGWQSTTSGGNTLLSLQISFTPAFLSRIRFSWQALAAAAGGVRSLIIRTGGSGGTNVLNVGLGTGAGAVFTDENVNAVCDYILIRLHTNGSTAKNKITNLLLNGLFNEDDNPFGANNCEP